MRWFFTGCIMALAATALAAGKEDARERRLNEQYKQCVQACRKPVLLPETDKDAWARNIREESRYDNCVHNCDRRLLRGFRK